MSKHLGTILHVVQFTITVILLGVLWYHFHMTAYAKSCTVRAAQGSVSTFVETVHLANGLDTTVPVAEMNHTIDDDVFRVHQDVDGKGVRVERFIRRHNGTLDKVKEIHFGGLTVTEDKKQ
jgi:hypothetical protein